MHTEREAASLAGLKEKVPAMPNPFDPVQQDAFESMLQSGRNPPKKIIPADVYHASWYDSAVKVVTDAVVRGWGNQCQQLRIEYRKITGLQTQTTFLKDHCGVVRKQIGRAHV